MQTWETMGNPWETRRKPLGKLGNSTGHERRAWKIVDRWEFGCSSAWRRCAYCIYILHAAWFLREQWWVQWKTQCMQYFS